MATCLSPSPSGRRLSELLEEKQEPFFLDLHLLEKGCSSSRLLDGYDTALCWPAAPGTDTAAAVLKRLTSKKNQAATKQKQQQQPAGGFLKLLLSKILHGKAAANNNRKKLQCSDSFKLAANNPAAVAPAPAPSSSDRLGKVKTGGSGQVKEKEKDETTTECSYSDDSDDEKQLSPVSVLEHPFESSPVHAKLSPSKNAAMDIFRELTQLLARSDELVKDSCSASDDDLVEEDEYCYGYGTSPYSGGAAAYWEAHRAELAAVSELVASEVPNSRLDAAAAVMPEREDVGASVAAAVFEALLEELVLDLC